MVPSSRLIVVSISSFKKYSPFIAQEVLDLSSIFDLWGLQCSWRRNAKQEQARISHDLSKNKLRIKRHCKWKRFIYTRAYSLGMVEQPSDFKGCIPESGWTSGQQLDDSEVAVFFE